MTKNARPMRRGRLARLLCVISLVTLCAFWPTFGNDFQMGWDDQWMVYNPMTTGHLDWKLLKIIFTTPFNGQWGPLNQLAYTLIFQSCAYSSHAYHIYSFAMHMANVWLVGLLAYRVLRDCSGQSALRVRNIVFIVTLLFAIHPLQVETVAWISASKILLSTLFYLGAAYALALFLKGGSVWCQVASTVLYACAYLSKENVLMFPLLAVLMCLMYRVSVRSCRFWAAVAPTSVLTLVFGLHLVFVVSGYNEVVHVETFGIVQRVMLCASTLAMYVYKWLFPVDLSWMYWLPVMPGSAFPLWMMLAPMSLAAVCVMAWTWLRKPMVSIPLAFFLIHLLFVIHLLFLPRSAIIADRYMYLPILGLNFLLAYALSWCMERVRPKAWRSVGVAILCAIVASCLTLTYQRTEQWHDSKVLRERDHLLYKSEEPQVIPINYMNN